MEIKKIFQMLGLVLAIGLMIGGKVDLDSDKSININNNLEKNSEKNLEIPRNSTKFHEIPRNSTKKLNLNTCSKLDLIELKGIGDKKANLIIANRPYKNPNDILNQGIIGKTVWEGIKGMVIVR